MEWVGEAIIALARGGEHCLGGEWWRLIYICRDDSWYIFASSSWYIFAASSSWCKCHLGQKWISTQICNDIITLCILTLLKKVERKAWLQINLTFFGICMYSSTKIQHNEWLTFVNDLQMLAATKCLNREHKSMGLECPSTSCVKVSLTLMLCPSVKIPPWTNGTYLVRSKCSQYDFK